MNQDQLLTRITEVLREDQRVLAAWLAGSRARGVDDSHSDIDVWLVVSEEDRDAFLEDWPALSDRVSPTVLRQPVFRTTFVHITPEWLRYDVSVGVPGDVPRRSRTALKPLFDRADLGGRLKPAGEPLQPDPAKVSSLVTEFMRVMGLLPVVLGREEYVVGASGAGLLRGLVLQLFLEDVAVEDRGGALRLTGLLPDDRLQALADLPPLAASRDSVLEVHLACARLFLPVARDLAARTGVTWPTALEEALHQHLRETLQVDLAELDSGPSPPTPT